MRQGNLIDRTTYITWGTIDQGADIRDWSLITGRGGYKTGGGAHEVLPLRKGGAEKVLAMLKGGAQKVVG